MYNQIGEKSCGGGGGGKRYVTNVCMYAALFRVYSGTITQTARRKARRRAHYRRRRESVPCAHHMKYITVLTWCRAPLNGWVCSLSVIRQFASPLGFHRLGYFRQWVPETSGLWVTEAVMGFGIHHGVGNTPWG